MQPNSQSLFSLLVIPRHRYSGSIDPMRARVTLAFAVFSMTASLLICAITFLFLRDTNFANAVISGALFAGVVPAVLVTVLVHTGYLRPAIWLTYLSLIAGSIAALNDGLASNALLILTLPMLFSGLVWELRGAVFTLIIETVMILIAASLQMRGLIAAAHPIPLN